jgi:hypothetical protein
VIVGATAVVLAVCDAPARAGVYTVSGCRTGWVPDVLNTSGGTYPATYDECDQATSRSLYAGLPGSRQDLANGGDYGGWRFDAPPNTAIVRLSLTWRGRGDYATGSWGAATVNVATSSNAQVFAWIDPFSATDSFPLQDASWARVYVACLASVGGTCRRSFFDANGAPDAVRVAIQRATVSILDRSAPEVASVGGTAAAVSVWAGRQPLAFSASDKGGGIFQIAVDVDGSVIETLPAAPDGRCVDPTGNRDFAYPVPCPTQTSGTANIDADRLPAGEHTIAVYIEDVAGNRTALIPPTRKRIVNDVQGAGYFAAGQFFNPRFATPRVLNGDGATSGAKLSAAFVRQVGKGRSRHSVKRASTEIRYSQRATVNGTLAAPGGDPIANATVFIGQRPEGRQWRLDGTARTDKRGRFVYRPASRQPNRRLRAVYFPFSDSHENVMSSALALRVRAGMTLDVNRHRLHNGDRLIFTGRVLGPVPAAGVAVTLQAKVGRHYRSFRQLRATSRTGGRIRTVYRFERTTRPARYRFRLKVVRQAGLPFQSGVSPVVSVSVRP